MNTNTQAPSLDQLRAKASAAIGNAKHDVDVAANQIRGTASELTDAVKSDMQQLVESAKVSGKAELAAAAERLSSYLGAIADSANALKQKSREQVQLVADTTDAYVHDKPWQSVAIGAGIGAAVGFALGCLATRR